MLYSFFVKETVGQKMLTNLHSQTSTPPPASRRTSLMCWAVAIFDLYKEVALNPPPSHIMRVRVRESVFESHLKQPKFENARIESGCAGHFERLGYQAPYPSKQLTTASRYTSIYAEPMTSLIFNQNQHQLSPSFLQTLVAHMACPLSLLPPLLFSSLHVTIPSSELFPPHSPPPPNSKRP